MTKKAMTETIWCIQKLSYIHNFFNKSRYNNQVINLNSRYESYYTKSNIQKFIRLIDFHLFLTIREVRWG